MNSRAAKIAAAVDPRSALRTAAWMVCRQASASRGLRLPELPLSRLSGHISCGWNRTADRFCLAQKIVIGHACDEITHPGRGCLRRAFVLLATIEQVDFQVSAGAAGKVVEIITE